MPTPASTMTMAVNRLNRKLDDALYDLRQLEIG